MSNPELFDRARAKSPAKIIIQGDEATIQLYNDLVKKRGVTKGRLTRFSNYLNTLNKESLLSAVEKTNLKLRIRNIQTIFTEFTDLQLKIEELVSEIDLEEQLNQREQFENSYYNIVAQAECLLSSKEASDSPRINSVKLPTITLPSFDGSCEHWLEFRDTFLSLIHESEHLSNIQKFHYLKSSLKGSAALVIEQLEFSSNNYNIALELLLNRYNNNNLLVHNHVKALFTVQKITKESPVLLRKLIDTILKNLRALKILGEPTESWDTLVIFIIVSKLDETTEREWEQYKSLTLKVDKALNKKCKVDDLLAFLKSRSDMLDTLNLSHSRPNTNGYKNTHKIQCNVSTSKSDRSSNRTKQCLMCKSNHPLYSCQQFLSASIKDKLEFVRIQKLCENCLRSNHTKDECRFGPCRVCNQKHNTLIHVDNNIVDSATSLIAQISRQETGLTTSSHSRAVDGASYTNITTAMNAPVVVNNMQMNECRTQTQSILLSTALVEIADRFNKFHAVRALLDNGSHRCIITKSLCKKLQLPLIQSTHEIRGIGSSVTQSTQNCDLVIRSRNDTYNTYIRCIVLPSITSALPTAFFHRDKFIIPNNYKLADPLYYESQSIDILLGADIFWDLLKTDKVRIYNGPFLIDTKLGWIVSGPIPHKAHREGIVHCNFSQSIDLQLRQFWELEEVPKPYDSRSREEIACEQHFVQNTKRNTDGRFIVSIPFKESPQVLGTSREQAERRFFALEKRLERDPTYKKLYCDFMREYCDLGHMSRVHTYSNPHYFMPHHGVYREQSTTTKLRVVFDASAPTTSGKSCNDIQLVGSPIQGDLFSILLRFRQYKYIACGDVEKMYRQALINPDNRDLQLILWREDPSHPLGIYQLNTITYGTASAPFLSVRCLRQLANECDDIEVKQCICEDMYVDDYISYRDNQYELLELCKKVSDVLNGGCFPLRKWLFNFKCDKSQSPLDFSKSLSLTESTHSKTLGLHWYNLSDELYFSTQLVKNNVKITKRFILSSVSQIYDPLGLLSPMIMIVKILLQKLWLLKLGWDDEVSHEIINIWDNFVNNLFLIQSLRIKRHVIPYKPMHIELHIFTDASKAAYGSCIYVRTVGINGAISVKLLCSKGKVAPLKPVTIPRLELCGALLGAKLFHKVNESLRCQFRSVTFWSDSTIVLGWLRTTPNLLQTFVQNRVVEIHTLTDGIPWRHIKGKENPADLVSRGVTLDKLVSCDLWWQGPQFLHDVDFNSNAYVNSNLDVGQGDLPELRPIKSHTFLCDESVKNILFPFHRFSQFNCMIRACAYLLRFIYNMRNRNNKRSGSLTLHELRESELVLAKFSQMESFPTEYKILKNKGFLNGKHNLSKLNLFIDDNDLIRVGGRLCNSDAFAYDKKYPILLSNKHTFTIILFRYQHKKMLHAGPQTLLFNLRESWWPLGGRNLSRKIVHECITCSRLRGKTFSPLMGNLPIERISASFPFYNCGVDYTGPVYILNRGGRGAKTHKAYICLFICFATRAVHLELVTDLTSDAYLQALKRFISRRGKPQQIFSDNGKNFVGLKNEFQTFLQNCSSDIIDYASTENIKFKFIPPYAAHFGGLWEAGVKSSKHHLIRVIGNAHLTYEEFSTVLTQVEAILNSRPLTPMSSDPNDLLPLSPGHFLIGRPITAPVCSSLRPASDDINRLPRYHRVEQIRQNFWSRWSKEFISEMQTRSKWNHKGKDLQPDTLVVLKDDCCPPLKWQLGRIITTYPGKDGVSRVADVRTQKGIVKRAFSKICPLFPLEPASSKAGSMSEHQSAIERMTRHRSTNHSHA